MESDVINEEDSFKTVKMTLNQFCSNKDIKCRINEFVLNANKIMFEAYAFANLHIIKCLNQNKDIPLINQTFFQNCCCFVTNMYQRNTKQPDDVEMNDTFNLYSNCRPDNYKPAFRDYNGILINYIKKDMIIATTNHLVLNFYNRITKYIKHKYNFDNKKTYSIVKQLYEKEYSGDDKIIIEWRNRLNNLPPTEKNVKKNPNYIVTIYNEILNYIIEHNLEPKNKAIRLFSILPHKNSFTISNITIDKSVLKDIISSFKKDECEDEIIIKFLNQKSSETKIEMINNPKKYWSLFFNIKNIKDFASIIKTDGNSVSIMYNNTREIESKKKKNLKGISKIKDDNDLTNINLNDFDTIKAFDPGFRYMYVGTNTTEKKENDITKCSSKSYYHKCQMNKASQQKHIIYKKNDFISNYFKQMPTNKTNDITNYLNYVTYSLSELTRCLKFHFDKPMRKLRFTTYIYKQKTMNELCKQITEKKHINDKSKALIGFGDWSNQKDSIIKGHRRGPIVALKRELKKWCKLCVVDEFRTSKLCCKCHNETEKMSYNNIKINSVLRCKNNECGTVIDRDINGCKNIYNILKNALEGKERPKAFLRTNTVYN